MEGLKYAKNSSVLFAINHKIDQRVKRKNTKFLIISNLMVAASILVIVFGGYFTFNFFNINLKNKDSLALNIKTEKTTQDLPQENFILPAKEKKETVVTEQATKKNTTKKQPNVPILVAKDEKTTRKKDKLNIENKKNITESLVIEESEMDNEVAASSETSTVMAMENNRNNGIITDKLSKNIITDSTLSKKRITTAQNYRTGNKGTEIATKDKKNKDKYSSKNNANKQAALSPTYTKNPVQLHKIDYIETYKVVDYIIEYQNDEDFKKEAESTSISPNFPTKADKDLADKEFDKSTLKITYKQTLKLGIHQFKLANYKAALIQFNLILAKHPKDVNALFYAGLCNYNLNDFTKTLQQLNKVLINKEIVFNQEANWYKALTFIRLKNNKEAKKLLNQIINENGFYKVQATEKLKAL